MANSSSSQGSLQRAGTQRFGMTRLISDKRGKKRVRASRIREAYTDAFIEQGQDEKQQSKGAKAPLKGRVYLVTIIEEGLGNSKDKNYYSPEALQKAAPLFNGSKAFCDHPDAISEKTLPERSMRALVGWYSDCFTDKNPTSGKIRLRGKLHFFPDAKWLTDKIDTILTDPSAKNLFGISINAIGKTRPAEMGGEEVNYVEEFQRVDSADVVTEPAARGKFDAMLESNRRKVTSDRMKRRTREAGILSPEKAKEVADSLVSACNSDSPDELKQAAFEASKVLHAASSISGKGPGQVNEEQYSNINPSGGSDSMKTKVKASRGSGGLHFRKKKALRAAAGTGADNEDLGEPEPSDIDPRIKESDVEDEEGRGELGDQAEYGGGSKYRSVKASRHGRPVLHSRQEEALEDEGMEGLEDEGLEDEGFEDEDGMAGMGGGAMGSAPPPQAAPPTPGSSRSVPASAAEADDSEDDSSEDDWDGSEDDSDMSESMEAFEGEEDEHDMMRPGTVAESRGRRHHSREADQGSGQGRTISKASYAGGLGHSGHMALPKGADPDRGYEDSDTDWGKEDSSTSGVGKSYKMKTSRFSRNKIQRRIAKPIVREANRRIEHLTREVSRLRESARAKDRKIERYKGIMRFNESKKSAHQLLNLAIEKEILTLGAARTLRESLYGLSRPEQVREIKHSAQLLESATEGALSRLTESVDGQGARGGVASWRPTGADNSELVNGFAEDGIPMREEK